MRNFEQTLFVDGRFAVGQQQGPFVTKDFRVHENSGEGNYHFLKGFPTMEEAKAYIDAIHEEERKNSGL